MGNGVPNKTFTIGKLQSSNNNNFHIPKSHITEVDFSLEFIIKIQEGP